MQPTKQIRNDNVDKRSETVGGYALESTTHDEHDSAATYPYSYYLAGCSISHIYMDVPQYMSHNILLPVYQLHLESALQPVLGPTVALPWPTVGIPLAYLVIMLVH